MTGTAVGDGGDEGADRQGEILDGRWGDAGGADT